MRPSLGRLFASSGIVSLNKLTFYLEPDSTSVYADNVKLQLVAEIRLLCVVTGLCRLLRLVVAVTCWSVISHMTFSPTLPYRAHICNTVAKSGASMVLVLSVLPWELHMKGHLEKL